MSDAKGDDGSRATSARGQDDGGGWHTAHGHGHRDRDGDARKSHDGGARRESDAREEAKVKWRGDGDGQGAASGGSRRERASRGERREKYGKDGGPPGWGKRDARDSWGSKAWIDGDGKRAEGGDAKAEGGEGRGRHGSGRAQAREGIPTRPAGRGFTMGRGKSGGQALELSLGALQVSSVSDAFFDAVMARKAASGQFADDGEKTGDDAAPAETPPEKKENGAKYRYDAAQLVTILREMEALQTCKLPEDVCGTNVPLKAIKPGDPMWELTMIGRHGDWQKKKEPVPEPKTAASAATTTRKVKDDVPEWAQEGNSLADASLTDDSFLGTALPQLTAEERLGLAGLGKPAVPAQEQSRTSRFVALEEDETLMPHLSHIGGMMQAPPQQTVQMPPMQMPPMQMPPPQQQIPPQQRQQMPPTQQQLPPPVPANVDWLYLDPSGQQQGPFTRQELIEWHQGGFFPNDLPCKPIDAPAGAPFMPLIELLQNGWRYRIPMQQAPPPQQQAPPPQQQGGLPPWLSQQAQPSGAPPPRGLTLEEIEQSHGIAPKAMSQQAARSNALANFAAGLGISSQAGGAPPRARGMTLADIENRHMHDRSGRQEVASADASSKWDAPPAARDVPRQPPPQPAMPPPVTMPPRVEPAPEPAKAAPTGPAWGGAAPALPAAVAGKTLLDIQREEEARAAQAAKNAPPPSTHTAFGGAWGGNAGGGGKSLKQIQEEEALRAAAKHEAEAAMAQQNQAMQTSGGWAAAAAPSQVAPRPSAPMVVPRSVPQSQAPKARPVIGNAVAPLTQSAMSSSAPLPSGLPPLNNKNALRAWCKAQMSQLNNSDDMTLVDFLLGLPSAGEVQEYVALYLGKTPQASAFAVELIRQKRADPSLAEGLGNGELAKVAAQGAGPGFSGADGEDNEAGWASAEKKRRGKK